MPLRNERALRFHELAGFKRELSTAKTAIIGGVKIEEVRLKRPDQRLSGRRHRMEQPGPGPHRPMAFRSGGFGWPRRVIAADDTARRHSLPHGLEGTGLLWRAISTTRACCCRR